MAKSGSKAKSRKQKSYRMMFRFWLDAEKDDELALADYCEEQKNNRSFTSTMRDAIRLIWDLREGKVNTLLELFPWVEKHFEDQYKKKIEDDPNRGNNVIDIRLANIEAMLLKNTGIGGGLASSSYKDINPAVARDQLAAGRSRPQLEAGLPEIEITKSASNGDAVRNYVRSLEVITGTKFSAPEPAQQSGGIKKMDVPELAAPSFDDDDDFDLFS